MTIPDPWFFVLKFQSGARDAGDAANEKTTSLRSNTRKVIRHVSRTVTIWGNNRQAVRCGLPQRRFDV